MRQLLTAAGLFGVLFCATIAQADTLTLVNGDTLHGKILNLNEKEVKVKSEVLGEITIPRDKVGVILFGEGRLGPDQQRLIMPKAPTDLKGVPTGQTPGEVLEQLRKGGYPEREIAEVQGEFPILGTPAVRGFFDQKVEGLISGELDLGDIRKDALKAKTQLDELKGDLGPEGAALDGYLSILNGFLDQTKEYAHDDEKKATQKK